MVDYPALRVMVPDAAPAANMLAGIPDQMRANQRMNLLEQQNQRAQESHVQSLADADQASQMKALEWLGTASLAAGDDPAKQQMLIRKATETFGVPVDMDDLQAARMHVQGGMKQKQANDASVYGTPIYTTDQEGNIGLGAMTKSGGFKPVQLPEGSTVAPGVKKVDLGTHWGFVDRSGNVVRQVQKDIAGQEREKAVGKAEGEREANAPKAAATMRDLESQWKLVDNTINKALNDINWGTVGFVGDWTKAVAGTPAYDLANTLMTIQANIGFDKLQSMRDNSPTGGALGQVSEFENRLLQSVRGALQQGQSAEQLKQNLEQVQRDLNALQKERKEAFEKTYGKMPEPKKQAGGNAPEVGTVIDGYQFLGGNPADPNNWARATF